MASKRLKVLRTISRLKRRSIILNIKISESEDRELDMLACKFTAGNKSEYARYAIFNFRPRARDLIEVESLPTVPLQIPNLLSNELAHTEHPQLEGQSSNEPALP